MIFWYASITFLLFAILLTMIVNLVLSRRAGPVDYHRIAQTIASQTLSQFPDGMPSDRTLTIFIKARYYNICTITGLDQGQTNRVLGMVKKLIVPAEKAEPKRFSFYD